MKYFYFIFELRNKKISNEIKLEKIIKTKYENIDKIWRKPPLKIDECKLFYENKKLLEDIEISLSNFNLLPLISKKVFNQEKFENTFKIIYEKYGAKWNKSKLEIPL